MKYTTHPSVVLSTSLALVLALAIYAPVQAQPPEAASEKLTMKDQMVGGDQTTTESKQKLIEEKSTMKVYVQDLESLALKNNDFRRVLYTAENCQLVLMALSPKEEIGAEVHKLDQFFRIEEGSGEVVLDGVRTAIRAGFAVVVPAGVNHNIINTGSVSMKLYTIYAPPNHRDGVVHRTRAEAQADNEHFDGKTTK